MKSLTLLLLLSISTSLFAQQSAPVLRTDYLKKSKTQKTIGMVILGTGVALTATAFLIPRGEITRISFSNIDYENDGKRNVFGSLGVLSMLGSIPFFVVASKTRNKAGSISFRNESIRSLKRTGFFYKPLPSVCVTFRL